MLGFVHQPSLPGSLLDVHFHYKAMANVVAILAIAPDVICFVTTQVDSLKADIKRCKVAINELYNAVSE